MRQTKVPEPKMEMPQPHGAPRAEVRGRSAARVPAPPPDRGRLLSADQVASDVFGGHVSPLWVRRNVPGKIKLGHVKRAWWEYDVRFWLETRSRADEEAA